ncbi:MAG TPA: DNA polymerase III subunit delta' [Candidatus Binatia bacterium]|jgi:DNA polymerase-3 subunit delta'|nr:DNA polymerase III subunit delta' [Candidatus Binatia bacterium]
MRFADVVGHEGAIARLAQIAADDRPAAAYLVTGPAGVGKRLLVDAFAARLLCTDPTDDDACGACAQCVRLIAGTHPDVRIVVRDDDRRDIRTEQARELTRWLGLRPLMAARKVAIIDGAECLNEHGQNALLKTLEEPPGASVLLLVATRVSLLLPTVRSRCQQVRLDPLPAASLERLLVGRDVPATQATLLAARAAGSPGRALSLVDDPDAALRSTVLERLAHLPDLSAADVSGMAQKLAKDSADAVLETIVAWYRDLLGLAAGAPMPLRNPDAQPALDAAAARTTTSTVLRQLEVVCDTVDAIGRNANKVLALETMLLALRQLERHPVRDAAWTTTS